MIRWGKPTSGSPSAAGAVEGDLRLQGGVWKIFPAVERIKWLLFAVALAVCAWGPLDEALQEAEDNWANVALSDWEQTNVWMKSTQCARETGAWLAICEDGRLIPISEQALGDDPGHALLLGLWAMVNDETASLVDVARLNIVLNTLGFSLLASFLFGLRAYICATTFLFLGPIVYVGWIGVTPHWAALGVASMAAVLPMAILAKANGFLPARLAKVFVCLGLLGLVMASLVREVIGLMGTMATIAVIVLVVVGRHGETRQIRGLLAVSLLSCLAFLSPYFVVAARDASFEVEPAQRVARHGFSDILYMGLGAVPNSLGISYDDNVALASAEQVDPNVVHCSPEFFRIMWQLYLEKVVSEPAEVARIYFEKAKLILADPILEPGPPLAVILLVGLAHFVVAARLGLWRRIRFSPGLLVEGAALVFIALFVAQAILATPARGHAMPLGAAILMVVGILLGFAGRLAKRLIAAVVARRR
jgi:hypothetical protein